MFIKMTIDYIGLFLDLFHILVFSAVVYLGLREKYSKQRYFNIWAIPVSIVAGYLLVFIFDPVKMLYTG